MKNHGIGIAFLALLTLAAPARAQTLPTNPSPTCVATPAQFKTWFKSGSVTSNGEVNPANSITFQPANNCNFYLWSQQMLLWLLSPAGTYGAANSRVFESSVFYQVSNASGNPPKRAFIPQIATNGEPFLPRLEPRPAKPGPNGFPAVLDRSGNIIEVVPSNFGANRLPLVSDRTGKDTEVKFVRVKEGRAHFFDAGGKEIAGPALKLAQNLLKAKVGQKFFTEDNTPVIVGPDGLVFDVSPGQAGGSAVLLAQNSSVVYYSILANDVYAYFATQNPGSTTVNFPTTQAELDQIQQLAGKVFLDGIALAVEVKLSWVDVSAVSNPKDYITTRARVPTYQKTSTLWTKTGETAATLALVGVHFVGSANGHPEMIWSTFEHFGNSPTGSYQYVNTSNQTVTVPASSAGQWLFSTSGSTGPFNQAHATYQSPCSSGGTKQPCIAAASPFTISPSDTQLVYPFGVAPTGQPNQEDLTPAAANTEVLSINNSVLSQLAPGDTRANYYFVGSTWTFGGVTPSGQYGVPSTNTGNGAEIGTNRLANSTMETYHQAGSGQPTGSNCFSCHDGGPVGQKATTIVSHIFNEMLPLVTHEQKAKPRQ